MKTIIVYTAETQMSTQYLAYKYRIYPEANQIVTLTQFFGAKRWIYNHFLSEQKSRFTAGEKHLSAFDCNKEITKLKQVPETTWLKTIDDWCLKHAAEDLSVAYANFFNSIKGKRKGKKVELPEYKSKYDNRQSYRTNGRHVRIDFDSGKISIPKIKNIRCVFDRKFTGTIKTATISKTASGKYFISILVEEAIQLKPQTFKEVGCDLGLKDLLILSNGVKFAHPEKMLSRAKKALKRAKQKLSKKKKGSSNYVKQRIKVARLYERVTNIRNAYYHNISSYLVNNFDAIYLENLNISGMLKNRKLARKIQESAWATLSRMIEYKAGFGGKTFYKIGRFVPSTKTCSCCGHVLESIKLDVREWECPSCHANHDRDLNAAMNIKNFGQIDLYDHKITSDESFEGEVILPTTLLKHASKIERSRSNSSLHGNGVTIYKNDNISCSL